MNVLEFFRQIFLNFYLCSHVCSQCHQSSSAAISEWLPKQWCHTYHCNTKYKIYHLYICLPIILWLKGFLSWKCHKTTELYKILNIYCFDQDILNLFGTVIIDFFNNFESKHLSLNDKASWGGVTFWCKWGQISWKKKKKLLW